MKDFILELITSQHLASSRSSFRLDFGVFGLKVQNFDETKFGSKQQNHLLLKLKFKLELNNILSILKQV